MDAVGCTTTTRFTVTSPSVKNSRFSSTAGITDPNVCIASLYHALLDVHNIVEAEESQRQTSPDELFNKFNNLLHYQIGPVLSPSRPQLIFIDALDESQPAITGGRNETVEVTATAFQRLPEHLPENVYVIATTRPVRDSTALVRREHLYWFNLNAPDYVNDNLQDGEDYVRERLIGSQVASQALHELARIPVATILYSNCCVTTSERLLSHRQSENF
jgi:hypothetical protein